MDSSSFSGTPVCYEYQNIHCLRTFFLGDTCIRNQYLNMYYYTSDEKTDMIIMENLKKMLRPLPIFTRPKIPKSPTSGS
jgi:hypothetical protein